MEETYDLWSHLPVRASSLQLMFTDGAAPLIVHASTEDTCETIAHVLTERRSNARSNVNWAVTTSLLIASTREEFERVISRWRARELHLEWDGVAFRGERRMLVKWIFPHDAAVAPHSSAGSQDRRGRAKEREQHFVVEAEAVALLTSEAEQLRALEEKNAKLKKLLTEQMLVAAALRELLPRKS